MIILIIIVSLILNAIVAAGFNDIAKMKGHTENYFWWVFLFPIAGYIMVAALPDRKQPSAEVSYSAKHPSSEGWACRQCGHVNNEKSSGCAKCGTIKGSVGNEE